MIILDGHNLSAHLDDALDREVIELDGQEVSRARTYAGTLHRFTADGGLWEVQTRAVEWPATEIREVRLDGQTVYAKLT